MGGKGRGGVGSKGKGRKGQNRGIHLSFYAVVSLSLISIPHPFFLFLRPSSSLVSLHHSIAICHSFSIFHSSHFILHPRTISSSQFYSVFNFLFHIISHSYFHSYLKI